MFSWAGKKSVWIRISVLVTSDVGQGKLRMEPEIPTDGLDDVPTLPEGVVWECWARPGNDAVNCSDGRELAIKVVAQKMKECGDGQ
jgi:hypothetical protein